MNARPATPSGGSAPDGKTGPRRILIIAGEVSGDIHAAGLVRELRRRDPHLQFTGIGGPEMRSAGVETLYDIEQMAVMGLVEVLKHYRFFRGVFNHMLKLAETTRPDAVILIDYPGFNLRFAEKAHRLGIKVLYYICPQVWAWHRSRIPAMAQKVDRLLTIFPFEKQHFEGTGLRVDFVGHPLVEIAARVRAEPPPALPWPGAPRVALLPGSRAQEIRRILPDLLSAAVRIRRSHPDAGFLIAAPGAAQERCIRLILDATPPDQKPEPACIGIVTGQTRHVLRQATATLIASGTATVEASLMECPMVITYRTAPLTYWLARKLIQIPFIGMVNVIANREVCPERIQHHANADELAKAVAPLLHDTPQRAAMISALREINASLGDEHAAKRAAQAVLDELALGSKFGSAKGRVHRAEDFDAPLTDMAEYEK